MMVLGRSRHDEVRVVAILCLAWGIVNFDMLGINYLMPFIVPSLKLSHMQVGILVSVYWVPFAFSSYFAGKLTDRIGKRKTFLLWTLLLFSVSSVLPGMATSFPALLTARLFMGLLEGPVLPLAQSIIALESPVERHGINMGIVQSLGASVFGFLSPLLLVELAIRHN